MTTTTNPPVANSTATPTDGSTPADLSGADPATTPQGTDCQNANSSGNPSFMGDNGSDPTVAGQDSGPLPPGPTTLGNYNVTYDGQQLPSLPTSGNPNNMDSFRLSKHFTLGELRQGEQIIPKSGSTRDGTRYSYTVWEQIRNLRMLCVLCLDPIVRHYGRKMTISNGYRAGTSGSAHCVGLAADTQYYNIPGLGSGRKHLEIATTIVRDIRIPHDQILHEWAPGPRKGGHAPSRNPWIHIGILQPGKTTPRSQISSFYNDVAYNGVYGRFQQMPGIRT